MFKRAAVFAGILLGGVLSVLVCLQERAADRIGNRIAADENAIPDGTRNFLLFNDRFFHERAKASFIRGIDRLGEPEVRDAAFRSTHRDFVRALVLNPFSPRTHFDFAQALQYMNALDLPFPERYVGEYRKAAVLSGLDHSIYAEVGRILLAHWETLLPVERLFTGDIVRRWLQGGSQAREDRLETFLRLWELNIRDPKVLWTILPADPGAYRLAARFLGERSLDRAARLGLLTRAEVLDFLDAGRDVRSAESEFRARRITPAAVYFRSAKKRLNGILFYQDLSGEAGIDAGEFKALLKTVQLGLVKCGIEGSGKMEAIVDDLQAYLAGEDVLAAVGELEKMLRDRGLIDDRTPSEIQDFTRFSFQLALSYRQNRFREVVRAGYALEQSLLILAEERKEQVGRLFELAGDACRKLDDLYESNAFYEKAAALGVADVGLRLKMRRNYERLNDDKALKALEPVIRERLAPRETALDGLTLNPEEPYEFSLALDEGKYRMTLVFSAAGGDPPPLMTIVFNGRVVWEDFISASSLDVDLPAVLGANRLRLTAVNRVSRPARMILVREAEARGMLPGPAPPRKTGAVKESSDYE